MVSLYKNVNTTFQKVTITPIGKVRSLLLWIEMNSEQHLLLLRIEPFRDLLGVRGGFSASTVVDDEIDPDLSLA